MATLAEAVNRLVLLCSSDQGTSLEECEGSTKECSEEENVEPQGKEEGLDLKLQQQEEKEVFDLGERKGELGEIDQNVDFIVDDFLSALLFVNRHRHTGAGNWHCSFVAATTTTSASRHCSVPPSAVPPSAFSRRDPALFFSVLWVPSRCRPPFLAVTQLCSPLSGYPQGAVRLFSPKVVWLSFDQVLTVISQKNHSQRLTKHQSKMNENSNIEAVGMSASTQPSSPPSSVRKNRSAVWDHFDVENAIEKKAKCKYCGSLIQYGNGTSSMGDWEYAESIVPFLRVFSDATIRVSDIFSSNDGACSMAASIDNLDDD
ncbi:hypothetical protein Ahy_A07g035922 [Arachis hypogaea]|uniref:BED-type domain-containing protein n=1 Tax=Arachis hypogaea TaxID=3818 RepID=A0A445CEW7_ARAHY|nr:hypothetical protein Ahy_A07g035922 [Arachis hypogaea]